MQRTLGMIFLPVKKLVRDFHIESFGSERTFIPRPEWNGYCRVLVILLVQVCQSCLDDLRLLRATIGSISSTISCGATLATSRWDNGFRRSCVRYVSPPIRGTGGGCRWQVRSCRVKWLTWQDTCDAVNGSTIAAPRMRDRTGLWG
jgi:hypothetical protein